MVTIREILNKLKWTNQLHNYVLIYLSRGHEGNVREIDLESLVGVYSNGFEYMEQGKVKYIPYHRVIEIRSKDGRTVLISRRHVLK
ncbi:MAG: hypothetical protein B6V02_00915 [Thermoprotei archaeon ex4572_64]|nr:MAG: hypothetical protein B6V02_00915 [Thermoprotei archaeon ex4572_64]